MPATISEQQVAGLRRLFHLVRIFQSVTKRSAVPGDLQEQATVSFLVVLDFFNVCLEIFNIHEWKGWISVW